MHEQREQEMLFNLLLKMIYQAVLQVLGASAADFGLLRELLFLVGNECTLTRLGVFRLVWMCL